MAIVTISRGSYSKGKEIAEKLAKRLDYTVLSRDVLLEASGDFNIDEVKLVRALHDSPSVLDRFTYGKERYMAYIKKELLEMVAKERIVYHGLAGQFLLKDLPNVLKVRIISDFEDRVKEEMKREDIDEQKARHVLKKDDEERRKWSLSLYGIDSWDPKLYDMVLHIGTLAVDDAVELLYDAAKLHSFARDEKAMKALENQLTAARVHAAIIAKYPTSKVSCVNGDCLVTIEASLGQEDKIVAKVKELTGEIEGIKSLRTVVSPVMTVD